MMMMMMMILSAVSAVDLAHYPDSSHKTRPSLSLKLLLC